MDVTSEMLAEAAAEDARTREQAMRAIGHYTRGCLTLPELIVDLCDLLG